MDDVELEHYLKTNMTRVRQAYDRAVAFLEKHKIPFVPSSAGHFVWIDLRRWMPAKDKDGQPFKNADDQETRLWLELLEGGICAWLGVTED